MDVQDRKPSQAVELLRQLPDQIALALEAYEKQLADAEATIRDQSEEIDKYKETVNKYRDCMKAMQEVQATMMAIGNHSESNQFSWSLQRVEVQDSIKKLVTEKDELITEVQNLKKENESLRKELTNCQSRVKEVCKTRCSKKEDTVTETAEHRQIDTGEMINLIDQTMRNQSDLIRSSELTVTNLTSKVAQLETMLNTRQNENDKLQKECHQIKSENGTLRRAVTETAQEKKELEERLQQSEARWGHAYNAQLWWAAQGSGLAEAKRKTILGWLHSVKQQLNIIKKKVLHFSTPGSLREEEKAYTEAHQLVTNIIQLLQSATE